MKRCVKGEGEGEGRSQITLLPECLDDYISEDNSVRETLRNVELMWFTGRLTPDFETPRRLSSRPRQGARPSAW